MFTIVIFNYICTFTPNHPLNCNTEAKPKQTNKKQLKTTREEKKLKVKEDQMSMNHDLKPFLNIRFQPHYHHDHS